MNKRMILWIIGTALLLFALWLAIGEARIPISGMGDNDTYLDRNYAILLFEEGYNTGLTLTRNFNVSLHGAGTTSDVATNISSSTQTCCYFVSDSSDAHLVVLNTTGNNVANITFSSTLSDVRGIAINASGRNITDIWVLNHTSKRIFHLDSTGAFSSDRLGNFSINASGDHPVGLEINVTNATPTHFYVYDYDSANISVFDTAGTNIENITLYGSTGYINEVWTNTTSGKPDYWWGVDLVGNNLMMFDSSGVKIEDEDLSAYGFSDPTGLTSIQKGRAVTQLVVSDYAADNISTFTPNYFTQVRLSTNETGSWANISHSGSPINNTGYWNQTNVTFTWDNNTVCNQKWGWKIFWVGSDGTENVSSERIVYSIPWINDTSDLYSYLIYQKCELYDRIRWVLSANPAGQVTFELPLNVSGGNKTCNWITQGATWSKQVNFTDRCKMWVNVSAIALGTYTRVLSPSDVLVKARPPNIPAAITFLSIAVIIYISALTTTEED